MYTGWQGAVSVATVVLKKNKVPEKNFIFIDSSHSPGQVYANLICACALDRTLEYLIQVHEKFSSWIALLLSAGRMGWFAAGGPFELGTKSNGGSSTPNALYLCTLLRKRSFFHSGFLFLYFLCSIVVPSLM